MAPSKEAVAAISQMRTQMMSPLSGHQGGEIHRAKLGTSHKDSIIHIWDRRCQDTNAVPGGMGVGHNTSESTGPEQANTEEHDQQRPGVTAEIKSVAHDELSDSESAE
ncbi:hypothetical protein EMCRGX_G027111 [Ephydatia muelleri]